MKLWDRVINSFTGRRERLLERRIRQIMNYASSITAGGGGRGTWMGMPADEDAANKEYAENRPKIMQRAQDLDVNNPDIGGFHRTRVAQIIGSGVKFRLTLIAKELGISEKQAVEIGEKVDRIRDLHSENGGFDSQFGLEWEGKRQEKALLTMLVYGCCLIHRVWRNTPGPGGILPISIEMIPGSRISTPYDLFGSPLVNYGVQYADNHRTRVTGFWVRRVSMTIGNSFVPDYTWDFLPAEDCALLSLTEAAGIDQALPLCTRTMRMLRNRGEFMENTVESVRAQSAHYGVTKVAPGVDPYGLAADDRGAVAAGGMGFVDLGSCVKMLYSMNGEEVTWSTAKLPEPDLSGFMDCTDERMARGLASSKSRYTRSVKGLSFAGGRLEDQQDDPIIDQYRLTLKAGWQRINGWFLECLWLTGAVDLPGYNVGTRHLWNNFRSEFPGKVDVSPKDQAGASETNLMLRKTTPQRQIEGTGNDPRQTLREWAKWMKMCREEEELAGLPEGSLDILFSGKAVTSQSGDEVGSPTPAEEKQPGEDGKNENENGGEP